MPNRLLWVPLSRAQLFVRLQLPFLAGVLGISGVTAAAVPGLFTSVPLLVGVALTVVASLVFTLPGDSWPSSRWVVVIPIVDIVAIACVRAALVPFLPTVGMLCLFPFAWIAYRFRWPALSLVFGGGVFIAALPFALGGRPVTTLLDLVNVVALPFIATGISVGIHLGAIGFRRGRERAELATAQLHETLDRSRDDRLLLRSILDTVNVAIAFYDAQNKLVLANQAAAKLVSTVGFRLDTPPYAGPHVLKADRRTPIPEDQQIIPRALRGEVIASHMEWLGSPGNQIAILASTRRVHKADGELLGTLITAYDVTELANAIEVREEFLTTVSHELRTPLTSIIGYTDEVIDVLGDEAERLRVGSSLETISRNADVLLERVGLLLTAADKRIELAPASVDLVRLLEQTVQPLRMVAERAGIALLTDFPPEMPAEVDPPRITQAVENLLTNAVKFTAHGGTITLRVTSENPDLAVISVSDTGIGMTPDDQRRIFDRFYRAHVVRKNAIQGIGVGLSIVKTIVEAHGGDIAVQSQPDVGTTIALRLPRVRPSEP